jgi:hypothetical protein
MKTAQEVVVGRAHVLNLVAPSRRVPWDKLFHRDLEDFGGAASWIVEVAEKGWRCGEEERSLSTGVDGRQARSQVGFPTSATSRASLR